MMRPIGPMPILILSLIWIGLLVGVSFLATPIKFAAPSLDLPVALDVGRHTFALFNRVEVALACVLLISALVGLRRMVLVVPFSLLLGLIAAQTIWLLPALDLRVGLIMRGEAPPPSWLHGAYVGAELLKLTCLVAIAFFAARAKAAVETNSSDLTK